MRPPESVHAARRGPVRFRLAGRLRTGSLVYWPSDGHRLNGAKARVRDSAGHWFSVAPADVELLDPSPV